MKNSSISILLIILLIIILPSITSANLGTFKQGNCISIRVLSNCSNINLVEVTSFNQTFVINSAMTHIGGQTFNYTFCNTSQLGMYSYSWNDFCIDCSEGQCGNSFFVTVTGQESSTSKAISYVLIWIIGLFVFLGLLIVGIYLPAENNRDQMTGYILDVNNLKYVKIFALLFAYLVAMFMAYFSWMICFAYLDMAFLSSIFQFLFYAELVFVLPIFVVGVYILIANWIRDSKISEMLLRGFKLK